MPKKYLHVSPCPTFPGNSISSSSHHQQDTLDTGNISSLKWGLVDSWCGVFGFINLHGLQASHGWVLCTQFALAHPAEDCRWCHMVQATPHLLPAILPRAHQLDLFQMMVAPAQTVACPMPERLPKPLASTAKNGMCMHHCKNSMDTIPTYPRFIL